MLRQTFTRIPGIGAVTETRLWEQGVDDWEKADPGAFPLSRRKLRLVADHLEQSEHAYAWKDARFFADRLPTGQHWRLS
ncbi:MAG: hypothetical protein ACODAQ_01345 [Phycisphaeraceae bacterium]